MEDSIVKMMELATIEPDKAFQKHSKGDAFDSGFERLDKNNVNDDDDDMFEKEYCTDIELDGSSFCWSDEESSNMQWLSRKSSVAALASNIFSTEFYSVLSSSHIRRKQVDLITSVAESLEIPFDDAESMLCYCQYVDSRLSPSALFDLLMMRLVYEDGNPTICRSSISQVPSRLARKPASTLHAWTPMPPSLSRWM